MAFFTLHTLRVVSVSSSRPRICRSYTGRTIAG